MAEHSRTLYAGEFVAHRLAGLAQMMMHDAELGVAVVDRMAHVLTGDDRHNDIASFEEERQAPRRRQDIAMLRAFADELESIENAEQRAPAKPL